jgi:SAM-dependent methyltransferase
MKDKQGIFYNLKGVAIGLLAMTEAFLKQSKWNVGQFISFLNDLHYWRKNATKEWKPLYRDLYPVINEKKSSAGTAKGHYFLQDIWAAQHVLKFNSEKHVDVGSRIDGFVAHVASFQPIEYVDIRPIEVGIENISSISGNICDLPYHDDSLESISCLHVLEHVGLGRYGDPLDVNSWLKGLQELQRVVKQGGQLLFSVPVGRQRICYNGHRVFSPKTILENLPDMKLVEYCLIESPNSTSWIKEASLDASDELFYGCGLFRFEKK